MATASLYAERANMCEAMEFRRATVADAVAIRDLTREAYAKWVPLIHLNGVLAGLIETIDEGSQLLIENVAVSPAFQRRGLDIGGGMIRVNMSKALQRR